MLKPQSESLAPRWFFLLCGIINVAGLGVSIYLTITHYTDKVALYCSESGTINCAKVTTSSYSVLAGIPLPILGLLFFIAMLVLCSPWVWRLSQEWRPLITARLLFAVGGVGMVFWLVYVELYKLNSICLYCTAVHILTLILFGVIAFGTALYF